MKKTLVRDRLEEWEGRAPWTDWNWRRRLAAALLFGLPLLVGFVAFAGAFETSWCGVWGGQCSPEEERELRVLSTVFWASYLVVVIDCAVMFVLRRRPSWCVAAVVGLVGFLAVVL